MRDRKEEGGGDEENKACERGIGMTDREGEKGGERKKLACRYPSVSSRWTGEKE